MRLLNQMEFRVHNWSNDDNFSVKTKCKPFIDTVVYKCLTTFKYIKPMLDKDCEILTLTKQKT